MDPQLIKLAKLEKIKRKCANDPVFFIENFCKTYDPRLEKSIIPFRLWDFQRDFVRELHSAYFLKTDILVDKSRDMGATWLEIVFDIWAWTFIDGFQCLWGGKKEDDVDDRTPSTLFGKVDIVMRHMPDFLKPEGFNLDNRTFMKLINPENGNTIIGESANQQFSRSGRYSKIFMDEFAFWDYSEKAWTASGDSSNHRVLVSTPNGLGNTFADIRFGGNINHFEMHWRLHPEKGEQAYFNPNEGIWKSPWYEKEVTRRLTSSEASIKSIKQELDIHYIQSGDPVFEGKFLKKHEMLIDHPHPFDNYAIGVDFSQGIEGRDLQSFDILSKATGKQVFHWHGKMPVNELARMLVEYAEFYNEALLTIERNNGGQELINRVKESGYRHLYYQKKYNKLTKQRTDSIGWYTDMNNKSMMVLDVQAALIEENILLTYQDTVDEMLIYQVLQKDGSNKYQYSAPKGKHDDKVMSLCIAWQGLKDVPMPKTLVELRKEKDKKQRFKKETKYLSNVCAY